MATLGLVGGLGPESTIDYYQRILAAWARRAPGSAPSIVIDSLDVDRALALVASDHAALAEYFVASVRRLAAAGAEVVAISANTPHIVFDAVAARSSVPLISIVEVCADAVRSAGCARVAVLGTRFTMEASFYPEVFARRGLAVVTPDADDRAWLHRVYVDELLRGTFTDAARDAVTALACRLHAAARIDGVVLAGTELPLLLRADTLDSLPLFDTTALHVAALVDSLWDAREA